MCTRTKKAVMWTVVGMTLGLAIGCERPAPPAPGVSAKRTEPVGEQPPAANPGAAASTPAPGPAGAPPMPGPATPAKEDVADLASPTFILGGLKFTKPETWSRVAPSNSMRKAELRSPGVGGAEEAVVAFSQAGGTVQWNLDRWKTQVTGPDGKPAEATIEVREVGGIKVHIFSSSGAYQDGMPGGPKTPREKWTLRGAVIETTPMLTFAKMMGPEETMTAAKPAWDAMIAGLVKAE